MIEPEQAARAKAQFGDWLAADRRTSAARSPLLRGGTENGSPGDGLLA